MNKGNPLRLTLVLQEPSANDRKKLQPRQRHLPRACTGSTTLDFAALDHRTSHSSVLQSLASTDEPCQIVVESRQQGRIIMNGDSYSRGNDCPTLLLLVRGLR